MLVGDSDDNDIDVPEYDEMTVRREERKEGEGKPSIGRANLLSSSLPPPPNSSLQVLFPVSAEDPFAWDRKSIALDESFLDMPRMARRAGSGHSGKKRGRKEGKRGRRDQ